MAKTSTVTVSIEHDLSKLIDALVALEEGFQDLAERTREAINEVENATASPYGTFAASPTREEREERSPLLSVPGVERFAKQTLKRYLGPGFERIVDDMTDDEAKHAIRKLGEAMLREEEETDDA